jgi:ABC-type polar amino acid transport system ATPase subunit
MLFMHDGVIAVDCPPREFFHERDDPRVKRFLNRLN